MLEQILVKSKTGQRCPKETRGMIYDHTPVQVPLTRYYQRMLAEGSLVRAEVPVTDNSAAKRLKKSEVADDRK
jgi:hypothetical protein